mmetsp:Transcript_23429/g.34170  ORF Transcript_23429/g.34170 Transcript_23429/m.34170 type:complete len:204 (+) Transcript_23429:120-731(+)
MTSLRKARQQQNKNMHNRPPLTSSMHILTKRMKFNLALLGIIGFAKNTTYHIGKFGYVYIKSRDMILDLLLIIFRVFFVIAQPFHNLKAQSNGIFGMGSVREDTYLNRSIEFDLVRDFTGLVRDFIIDFLMRLMLLLVWASSVAVRIFGLMYGNHGVCALSISFFVVGCHIWCFVYNIKKRSGWCIYRHAFGMRRCRNEYGHG